MTKLQVVSVQGKFVEFAGEVLAELAEVECQTQLIISELNHSDGTWEAILPEGANTANIDPRFGFYAYADGFILQGRYEDESDLASHGERTQYPIIDSTLLGLFDVVRQANPSIVFTLSTEPLYWSQEPSRPVFPIESRYLSVVDATAEYFDFRRSILMASGGHGDAIVAGRLSNHNALELLYVLIECYDGEGYFYWRESTTPSLSAGLST